MTKINDFLYKLPFFNQVQVGSRATCNPPPTNTDLDILVQVTEAEFDRAIQLLEENGFERESGRYAEMPSFLSYRNLIGDLNVILTTSDDFYQRFVAAAHVCAKLNLMHKGDRIMVHQAVLYANIWREVTP